MCTHAMLDSQSDNPSLQSKAGTSVRHQPAGGGGDCGSVLNTEGRPTQNYDLVGNRPRLAEVL